MKEGRETREIVLVYGRHENGGAQRRAVTLANALSREGYRVWLLAMRGTVGGTTQDVFYHIEEGVRLVFLPDFVDQHKDDPSVTQDAEQRQRETRRLRRCRTLLGWFPGVSDRVAETLKNIRTGEPMRSFLLCHPNAVVLTFGINCYEVAVCAAMGLDCKTVFVEINAPEVYLEGKPATKERSFSILSYAHHAVFQTEDEREFYEACCKKSTVIHNPVAQGLPEPYEGERRPVVVNFCRLNPQKNIPLLIHAFEKLYAEYPYYSLEIYGNAVSDKELAYREEFQQIIDASSAKEAIHLLPPRKDVHAVVRDCAMFVSSSDFEGLSNSMIEAMAIGLPCLCTDCLGGGAREMIRHGENGLLTKVGDVDSLYEGMKQFIDDPMLAKRCGENAACVRDELSTERIIEKWLTVIDEVM